MQPFIACTPRRLPPGLQVQAMHTAVAENPANRPMVQRLPGLEPQHIAAITTKYWGAAGVALSVGFSAEVTSALGDRLLSHMNAWGQVANVAFTRARSFATGQVRVTTAGDGYWSYLGTDVLSIPASEPTMTLQSFDMNMPESEFRRVVRHETGHTLGFPHEHMRAAIVARIDAARAIAYFAQTQGWSAQEVEDQVLTPLDEKTLMSTPADKDSIMCYQLPGSITTDGTPIPGGLDIDASDYAFAVKLYPRAAGPVSPPPPPPPPPPPSAPAPPLAVALAAGDWHEVSLFGPIRSVRVGTDPSDIATIWTRPGS